MSIIAQIIDSVWYPWILLCKPKTSYISGWLSKILLTYVAKKTGNYNLTVHKFIKAAIESKKVDNGRFTIHS